MNNSQIKGSQNTIYYFKKEKHRGTLERLTEILFPYQHPNELKIERLRNQESTRKIMSKEDHWKCTLSFSILYEKFCQFS